MDFKLKNLLILLIFIVAASAIAEPTDIGFNRTIDEDIQGDPTTVTRYNACVEEKFKAFNPIMGTIPLAPGSLPASDLICDSDECGPEIRRGDKLTPAQAKKYFDKRFNETRCQWSLADLDPAEDPEIWENKISGDLDDDSDAFDIEDMDKTYFVSQAWGRLGSYRVTVAKYNFFGQKIPYTLLLSKTIHNYMLRKSLLEKLGYKIPPVKWLKRVKVKFDSKNQMNTFISELSQNNAGSFDRWVLSKTNNNEVVLQDVLIMEDQEFSLNLSKGFVSQDIAQGKRIYDSLLVPFSLVEVPESINMFDWTYAREYSSNLVVNYPLSRDFDTSYHDALWMARRIMKLSEKDWWEIVESTQLPSSVKLLLFHKLKSRRNHLGQLFGIDNIELAVDTKISNQKDLVEGEIVQEFYDGYARRFKMPDPESPIDSDKMRSFFKSKALSFGLDAIEKYINSRGFMGTDIGENIDREIQEILAKNVSDTLTTGQTTKTPIKTYIFPTVQGSLVFNRDIIAGPYLGTDNRLQLVDSVGGVMSAGVFGGITGIYAKTGEKVTVADEIIRQKVPVSLTAHAKMNVSRIYSHVKPIMSIEQGLKYDFKNIIVPRILNNNANVINDLVSDDFLNAFDANQEEGVSRMLSLLNENMEVGESLIITDSIGAEVAANAGVNLYELVDVKVSARPSRLVLSRLHILRKSEDEFHIYKSLGNVKSIELSASVEKYIPITKITFKLTKGRARTKYYRFKIGERNIHGEENYNRLEKLKALASVMSNGTLAAMNTVVPPFILQHNFTEDSTKFGIFVWRWNWLDQNDEITIVNPQGQQINLFRRMEGSSSGRDYENYARDIINGLAGELLDVKFGFKSFNAGNPGFTYQGKAKNLVATYEGIKTQDGRMVKPFLKLSRIYNGWKMSKESVLDKIAKIERRYDYEFFKPEDLANTDSLFLYNINVNFFVQDRGIDWLMSQEDNVIESIWINFSQDRRYNNKDLDNFLRAIRWYKIQERRQNFDEIAEMGVKLLRLAESNLNLRGIMSMFGGARNVMAIGKIDGYRVGDEDGDQSIISSSKGRVGDSQLEGPVGEIRKVLGMTSGEFYIYWLLGRVI
ncbi:MAG: hypothetical protein CME62_04020 [Halobacteriovoraceae bacterium]|nr:hypothetical protein [Halobacteriovoraceae bacterium]|tara:strand:+ start:123 stop:3404 length:3282 start_codon:yes stop_codon:yes gene_type:complete